MDKDCDLTRHGMEPFCFKSSVLQSLRTRPTLCFPILSGVRGTFTECSQLPSGSAGNPRLCGQLGRDEPEHFEACCPREGRPSGEV